MSEPMSVQFTRFSAFYSPLIATIVGGFLRQEGLEPRHSVAPPGESAIEGVVAGTVDVCQSAPSQGFGPLEKGQAPPVAHFAQINEMDASFSPGGLPTRGSPGTGSRAGACSWITAANRWPCSSTPVTGGASTSRASRR